MATSRELQHLKFWSGQLLAAADLQSLVASDARRRALHNRAVHHTYGIAIGFAVTAAPQGFNVMCGLGYDCSGAEIFLPRAVVVPPPDDPATTLLVVARGRSGIAEFGWVAPGRFNWRRGVALKRIGVDGFRPIVARPLALPKMASGQTVPGGTSWQSWRGSHEEEIGVRTRVNTSAAGFVTTPHYFATVRGDDSAPGTWFTSIADATPSSFSLQLFFRKIARQRLQIVSSVARVDAPPEGAVVRVDDSSKFVRGDLIARLAPIAGAAAAIKSIAASTVTLETALPLGNDPVLVACGHLPRVAVAQSINAFDETVLTLDDVTLFSSGGVIVRLRGPVAGARPATIDSVNPANSTVKLKTPLRPLAEGDAVGQVAATSIVTDVKAAKVTVINPNLFPIGSVVVRLGVSSVEASTPALVVANTGNVLVLSPTIDGLAIGEPLGVVGRAATVVHTGVVAEVLIPLTATPPNPFEIGDLVTRRVVGGLFSAPAKVVKVGTKNKPSVTLSAPLAGLVASDTISGMDPGERATVLSAVIVGTRQTVVISNPQIFSVGAFVGRVNEQGFTSTPSTVQDSGATAIVIEPAIANLAAGEVLAVLTVPAIAKVAAVEAGGRTIRTTEAHRFKPLDTISAMPTRAGLALVSSVDGLTLHVTPALPDIQAGDGIQAVALSGVVEATRKTSVTVDVDEVGMLRDTDLLGVREGWRDATLPRGVDDSAANRLTLNGVLDGVLPHDVVGTASLVPDRLALRLSEPAGVNRGDDVMLAGFDRLAGEQVSVTARVTDHNQNRTRLSLGIDPGQTFTLRPENVDASVPLISGSPVQLANQFHLYVTWFACNELPDRPEPCSDPSPQLDPCEQPVAVEKKGCC